MIYAHTITITFKSTDQIAHLGVIESAIKSCPYPDPGLELLSVELQDSEQQPASATFTPEQSK